jgi:hypothetical protein
VLAESERGPWLLRGRDMRVVYVGAGACGCCMLPAVCYVCVQAQAEEASVIVSEVAYSGVCACWRGNRHACGAVMQGLHACGQPQHVCACVCLFEWEYMSSGENSRFLCV